MQKRDTFSGLKMPSEHDGYSKKFEKKVARNASKATTPGAVAVMIRMQRKRSVFDHNCINTIMVLI